MVTPLYCESARILSKLSSIMNRKDNSERYKNLADEIKKAYINKFLVKGTGKFEPHTQAGQAFALSLNMAPLQERQKALEVLLDYIHKRDDHLSTGIFGTKFMLDVLSREGHIKTATTIVNQKTFPGWGYMLENGATTLWEHWALSTNTFSHSHPMFGSVTQWFFNWLGGIQPHPDAFGFDRIILKPQFVEDLDWVRCHYNSIRGRITSNWRRRGNEICLDIELPVNVSAELFLPTDDPGNIRENEKQIEKITEIIILRKEKDATVCRIGSGKYSFKIQI